MTIIRIEAPDDPRIADYVSVREADLVKRRGIFIAEGAVVIRTLVQQGRFAVRSLFLAERKVEPMQDVLQSLPSEVPVYVAPQPIMESVTGFPIHRGCLAAGERGVEPGAAALLDRFPEARTVVVLEAIANHDNIGGIFRNALAFRGEVVLLDPRCADPLYRKAIRVSMGASLRVPFARGSELPALLRARKFTCIALTPRNATAIAEVNWPERAALFFGTEAEGLDEATIDACDVRVMIPMSPVIDSLNVSTASGIALFARDSTMSCERPSRL